jgi:hypothetical protein
MSESWKYVKYCVVWEAIEIWAIGQCHFEPFDLSYEYVLLGVLEVEENAISVCHIMPLQMTCHHAMSYPHKQKVGE